MGPPPLAAMPSACTALLLCSERREDTFGDVKTRHRNWFLSRVAAKVLRNPTRAGAYI